MQATNNFGGGAGGNVDPAILIAIVGVMLVVLAVWLGVVILF